MKREILLVDDERELSAIISKMLEGCGYSVTCTDCASGAFNLLAAKRFDLLILDVNLPDADGFEICRNLREVSEVPVIFASARTAEDDKVNALEIGGDDYMEKPFSLKELLARVNALIRRTYGLQQSQEVWRFGEVEIHPASRQVSKRGNPVSLAQREFDLLVYLYQNRNNAIPKERILAAVWGAFSEVEPSTLTVHIRWLREKLEDDPAHPQYIKTIWRLGYMLEAEE